MSSSFMFKSSQGKLTDPGFSRSDFFNRDKRSFKSRVSNLFNWIWNQSIMLKSKFKSLLWVGSTAFVFLALPIIFTILVESEHELERLQRATDSKL